MYISGDIEMPFLVIYRTYTCVCVYTRVYIHRKMNA